ncbi:BgTH12-06221 [Blumeria graminis f. sp. triticale]|uniref:BgTH12-06221 n=1 Tax=Blumeria graminis f. sp. triticale TaxID=1689686 RepID=A0A9W4GD99_BLUGR|nr:BgTH12-06221 [Blumeria graminis f. sp. triticale]
MIIIPANDTDFYPYIRIPYSYSLLISPTRITFSCPIPGRVTVLLLPLIRPSLFHAKPALDSAGYRQLPAYKPSHGSLINFGSLENYRTQARTALNQRTLPEVSITVLESIISSQWQGIQVLYKSQAAQPRYFWHKLPGDSRDNIVTKYILVIDILGNISGLMANTASTTIRTPVTVANSHMCYIASG